jgi:uncharacterized protein with HEPN domain
MSKRSPQLLLEDILDSANKILDYTNGLSYEQFLDDNKTIDAVIRNSDLIQRQIRDHLFTFLHKNIIFNI